MDKFKEVSKHNLQMEEDFGKGEEGIDFVEKT